MSHDSKLSPLGSIIMGVVFALIGGSVAFVWGKPMLDKAKASKNWPTASGVVQESRVETHRGDDSTTYSPHVIYTYAVDGLEYKSDTIYFGKYSSNSISTHQEVVKRYPEKKKVDVYYDPENPVTSVLEPGAKWSSYLAYGCGLVFLVIGLALAGWPLAVVGLAVFTGDGGRSQSPWQDDSMSAQPWSGGDAEEAGTSGSPAPEHERTYLDEDEDGIDIG